MPKIKSKIFFLIILLGLNFGISIHLKADIIISDLLNHQEAEVETTFTKDNLNDDLENTSVSDGLLLKTIKKNSAESSILEAGSKLYKHQEVKDDYKTSSILENIFLLSSVLEKQEPSNDNTSDDNKSLILRGVKFFLAGEIIEDFNNLKQKVKKENPSINNLNKNLQVIEKELSDGHKVEQNILGQQNLVGQEVITRPSGRKVYRYFSYSTDKNEEKEN